MARRRANGEGTVRQRTDGTWEGRAIVSYDENGKPKLRSIYGRTQREVIDKMARLKADSLAGLPIDTQRLTVGEYLSSWLAATKATVRAGTYDNYEGAVRREIRPRLGGVQLAALTPLHIEGFYSAMAKDRRTPSVIAAADKALRRAINVAMQKDLIPRSPFRGVASPKVPKRKPRFLSVEEATRLLDAARGDRLEALYVLALTTGLREGELLALQWRDIDFTTKTARVERSLDRDGNIGETKTAGSCREVVLTARALDALRAHQERMKSEGNLGLFVFCAPGGGMVRKSNFIRRSFEPLLIRAGLCAPRPKRPRKKRGEPAAKEEPKVLAPRRDIRFHDLRHSAGSVLRKLGVDLKIIQQILGHSKLSTTADIYLHLDRESQEGAARKLDKVFNATAKKAGKTGTGRMAGQLW